MPTATIVSFRLGHADGVSVVARHWGLALRALAFTVTTVAGEGPVDVVLPGLAIDAPEPPRGDEVEQALAAADLVVVENLCTIPLNLPAARAVAGALRGRPAVLHHHDPPWQRERFAHITELPPDDPAWLHVTVNDLTRDQLAERGIRATTVYNGFAVPEPSGRRSPVRAAIGVNEHELLVLHPVRAIARKNVPAALALCETLGATYWLPGPAEEGYGAELARLLSAARCRTLHIPLETGFDGAYEACDAVVFPSTWEGFGNPPIEAAFHRRPAAVGTYPVAAELRRLGFHWFPTDDAGPLRDFLRDPDPEVLDRNRAIAVENFSLDALTERLRGLLDAAGWLPR